jgi:tRNA threonylcarbamoyladenosine modification (KEOPS) complex  Pcc1 subunit
MFAMQIKIDFDSEKKAKLFFSSIKPELEEKFSRSETKISLSKAQMGVDIRAQDRTAMRATLNAIAKPLMLFNKLESIK